MPSMPEFTSRLLQSRKYRALHLPPETIQDLIEQESLRYSTPREIQESVRKKLHQLTALYLGDPDYAQAIQELETLSSQEDLLAFSQRMLATHTSTRERLPYLEEFYRSIFKLTGKPNHILDLACGLQPFAVPAMGLAQETVYQAYDIHLPRVELINAFFQKLEMSNAQAVQRDILVSPPSHKADVAFFFKEAHRMEQRRKGSNRLLWGALQVDFLLVSLPRLDIGKTHDLSQRMENLVLETMQGASWQMEKLLFEDEIVFCIHKEKKG